MEINSIIVNGRIPQSVAEEDREALIEAHELFADELLHASASERIRSLSKVIEILDAREAAGQCSAEHAEWWRSLLVEPVEDLITQCQCGLPLPEALFSPIWEFRYARECARIKSVEFRSGRANAYIQLLRFLTPSERRHFEELASRWDWQL